MLGHAPIFGMLEMYEISEMMRRATIRVNTRKVRVSAANSFSMPPFGGYANSFALGIGALL